MTKFSHSVLALLVLSFCGSAQAQSSPRSLKSFQAIMYVDCNSFAHNRLVNVSTAQELTNALATVKTGDLIVLADGNYPGNFVAERISGSPTAPITVCGTSKAALDGTKVVSGYVLHLKGVSHWNIAGITLTNGQKGLMLDSSSHNIIKGTTITQIGDEAVHFRTNSQYNVLSESLIMNTGLRNKAMGQGVYIGSTKVSFPNDQSDHNQIMDNYIGPGVTAENIVAREYSANGLISGNTLDGAGLTAAKAWINIQGNHYLVYENTGINTLADGFQTQIVVPGWGDFNVFDSNTLQVEASGYGIRIQTDAEGDSENTVRCNNFAFGAESGLTNVTCQK